MPEKKLSTTGKLSQKEINVTKNKENTEIVKAVYLKKLRRQGRPRKMIKNSYVRKGHPKGSDSRVPTLRIRKWRATLKQILCS